MANIKLYMYVSGAHPVCQILSLWPLSLKVCSPRIYYVKISMYLKYELGREEPSERNWGSGEGGGVSVRTSGGEGSGEGHCCSRKESRQHPRTLQKGYWEKKKGVADGEGEEGVYWECRRKRNGGNWGGR